MQNETTNTDTLRQSLAKLEEAYPLLSAAEDALGDLSAGVDRGAYHRVSIAAEHVLEASKILAGCIADGR